MLVACLGKKVELVLQKVLRSAHYKAHRMEAAMPMYVFGCWEGRLIGSRTPDSEAHSQIGNAFPSQTSGGKYLCVRSKEERRKKRSP